MYETNIDSIAFKQGVEAGEKLELPESCPYKVLSEERYNWFTGYWTKVFIPKDKPERRKTNSPSSYRQLTETTSIPFRVSDEDVASLKAEYYRRWGQ